MKRTHSLLLGIVAVIVTTWLWHAPLGAGEHFALAREQAARNQLDQDEMFQVRARMERAPLRRRLVLSGPADDFQRREIKRRMETLPGVSEAVWSASSMRAEAIG
jgi:hypothetical protein